MFKYVDDVDLLTAELDPNEGYQPITNFFLNPKSEAWAFLQSVMWTLSKDPSRRPIASELLQSRYLRHSHTPQEAPDEASDDTVEKRDGGDWTATSPAWRPSASAWSPQRRRMRYAAQAKLRLWILCRAGYRKPAATGAARRATTRRLTTRKRKMTRAEVE